METNLHDTRQTVLRMVQHDPAISAAEIARQAGVTRQRAAQILESLGYILDQKWRKRRRKLRKAG